jgi:hypothetical protein
LFLPLFPIVLAPAAFFPSRQGVALCFASHFPLQIACICFSPGLSGQRARRAADALPPRGCVAVKKHSAGKDIGKVELTRFRGDPNI